MRYIIWYIRSSFCKHDFKLEESFAKGVYKSGDRVSATCKECNWHRSYWKYL